jgi:hypothetical protein
VLFTALNSALKNKDGSLATVLYSAYKMYLNDHVLVFEEEIGVAPDLTREHFGFWETLTPICFYASVSLNDCQCS